jgi:hypothetical protein
MTAYSADELRYARPLVAAFLKSGDFRQWLLGGTKHEKNITNAAPAGEIQGSLRSPNIKNPYWFNYFCPKDSKCTCRIESGIETDILLILRCANHRNLGVHIEVKRPGDHLRNGQAESYPRRAACWTNPDTRPRTVLPHDGFLTILVCGRDIASDPRIRFFDKVVFHDDLARKLDVYPEP